MKVSSQPESAFAVYSEKLKQKKKKSKTLVTNGVTKLKKLQVSTGGNKLLKKFQVSNVKNKLKKTQVSNEVNKPVKGVNKKTRQMQEIGYILSMLAEKSADTSTPRATALSNSISEANEKLDHNGSAYLEDIFKDVVVDDLKQKKTSLKNVKRRERNKAVVELSQLDNGFNTKPSKLEKTPKTDHLTVGRKNRTPAESSKTTHLPYGDVLLETSKLKVSKLKNKRTSFKEEEAVRLNSKAGHTKKIKITSKSPSEENLVKKISSDQREIISKKKGKRKPQKHHEYSNSTSKQLFEWLIVPVSEKDFMGNFWEKKPLLIQREGNRNHYSELLSTETIDTMLRENNVCFTKHLDVTSYTDGVRETHNMTGRAQANVVWDFYSNDCSIRLLNPQIFLPKIHVLNATLQEYFGCFVGANVYLTPPNSQGFAPHYDDIEAFVLQVEGKKHWRVYTPRTDTEVLPRFSSPNFSQEEIGEPFLDVTLEPGDLLYFPRGFIHQATTVEGEHSLHITLSAYQKTAWVDLFEKVLPIALKRAAESDVEFRRGLPRDYLGLECGTSVEKQSFVNTAQTLMEKLGHYLQLSLGAGVDQMGAQFMHDALPPVLTPSERQNTSVGGGLKLKNGKLEGRVEFQIDTCIKLTRHNICRLVEVEGEVRLYHCLENSLEYHGEEPQFLVLPAEGVQVISHLQTSFPEFVPIGVIPHEDQEALLTLVSDLWDAGLLSAKELPVVEES